MQAAAKILLVSIGGAPESLSQELTRLGLTVISGALSEVEEMIETDQPDLIVLSGPRGAVELAMILDDQEVKHCPKMVIVAERRELAKLKGLNRDVVVSLFATETGEGVVGQRIESLARRASRRRDQGLSAPPPMGKKTTLGLPSGRAALGRVPFQNAAAQPPRAQLSRPAVNSALASQGPEPSKVAPAAQVRSPTATADKAETAVTPSVGRREAPAFKKPSVSTQGGAQNAGGSQTNQLYREARGDVREEELGRAARKRRAPLPVAPRPKNEEPDEAAPDSLVLIDDELLESIAPTNPPEKSELTLEQVPSAPGVPSISFGRGVDVPPTLPPGARGEGALSTNGSTDDVKKESTAAVSSSADSELDVSSALIALERLEGALETASPDGGSDLEEGRNRKEVEPASDSEVSSSGQLTKSNLIASIQETAAAEKLRLSQEQQDSDAQTHSEDEGQPVEERVVSEDKEPPVEEKVVLTAKAPDVEEKLVSGETAPFSEGQMADAPFDRGDEDEETDNQVEEKSDAEDLETVVFQVGEKAAQTDASHSVSREVNSVSSEEKGPQEDAETVEKDEVSSSAVDEDKNSHNREKGEAVMASPTAAPESIEGLPKKRGGSKTVLLALGGAAAVGALYFAAGRNTAPNHETSRSDSVASDSQSSSVGLAAQNTGVKVAAQHSTTAATTAVVSASQGASPVDGVGPNGKSAISVQEKPSSEKIPSNTASSAQQNSQLKVGGSPGSVDVSNPYRVADKNMPDCEAVLSNEPPLTSSGDPVHEASKVWASARKEIVGGKLKAAKVHMCKAVQLNPQSAAMEGLAQLYLREGSPAQALHWANQVEALRPGQLEMAYVRADAYGLQGKIEKSREILLASFKLDASQKKRIAAVSKDYSVEAGRFLRRGDYSRAELWFRRAVTLDPENLTGFIGLAKTYLRSERPQYARVFGELSLKISDVVPEVHVLLGELDLSEGKKEAARLRFERALAVRPGFYPAKRGLRNARE